MATEYIGQKPPFTALPNWLRGKTTPLELAVMWCLQSHFPNIHPGLELLHKEAGMAKSTLCLVLTGLERKGWVRRERAFLENGRSTSTRYRLTIWETHWQVEAEQSARSVRETDSTECPGDGQLKVSGRRTGSVRETDRECPGDGQEVDKSKKINSKKALEPPLPPSGGNAGEGQGELMTVEALPVALPVDAALSKSPEPAKVPEPPPQTMALTKPRKPRFQPSHDQIPAELLPVHPEILGFWAVKAGARTQQAWNGLMTQLALIQQDPLGGTEALRSQLQEGIDRAPIKPWMSITHSLWRMYGMKGARTGLGGNRRKTPEEHAADSIAFIEARDARRAAAASASGQTVLCEVLA
jgi:hypothetical protein